MAIFNSYVKLPEGNIFYFLGDNNGFHPVFEGWSQKKNRQYDHSHWFRLLQRFWYMFNLDTDLHRKKWENWLENPWFPAFPVPIFPHKPIHWKNIIWLVVSTPLKNISQWLFPICGKIKNVPNHQPGKMHYNDAGIPIDWLMLRVIQLP